MPQMAPYNWFFLFLMFNLINHFIISMNYFLFMPTYKFNFKIKFMSKFKFLW